MNNFNFRQNSTSFTGKLTKDEPDNHGNCPTKIVKRLPFWINNQVFWIYQCKCCSAYQFEKGKVSQEWGGIYE